VDDQKGIFTPAGALLCRRGVGKEQASQPEKKGTSAAAARREKEVGTAEGKEVPRLAGHQPYASIDHQRRLPKKLPEDPCRATRGNHLNSAEWGQGHSFVSLFARKKKKKKRL